MKKLVVFVLMVFPVLLNAQSGRLINRIDREIGTTIKHEVHIQKAPEGDMTLLNQPIVNTVEIAGKVRDENGPLGGARIMIRHNDLNNTSEVSFGSELLTYSDGTYYFAGLAPGKYRAYVDPKQLEFLHSSATPQYIDFETSKKEEGDFKTGLNFALKGSDRVIVKQPMTGEGKTFNILITDTVINFDPNSLATITGTIVNLTQNPVKIIFHRMHVRLPQDWTSSVCFGLNCFSSITDSIPETSAFNLDPNKQGEFVLNLFDPDDYIGVDSLVDYIRFNAVGSTAGDTVSYTFKAVLNEQAGVQDHQPKQTLTNPKIVMIYPSPLVQGSTIKVKVSSPRESNLSYSIYDGVGRVVALGVTRQHIVLGDNTISIGSLDGLGNGSYMLKFNFGDGSSDTHFFQILH